MPPRRLDARRFSMQKPNTSLVLGEWARWSTCRCVFWAVHLCSVPLPAPSGRLTSGPERAQASRVTLVGRLVGRSARVGACRELGQSISPVIEWSMTRCPVSLVVHDQRRPARPDCAKADRWLPVPPTASSTVTGARDARRRRRCDVDCLARSETAQAVRVRILVRVAAPVTHQPSGNASDPKTPPSGASAKLPPITFPPYAKIALVYDWRAQAASLT